MTLSDNILAYNQQLLFPGSLPEDTKVIDAFTGPGSGHTLSATRCFYLKYYNDYLPRTLILGINPGRHGAGTTGIPFTDSKRLENNCNITWDGPSTHEPSSVFIYEVIHALGGPEHFYKKYFINSLCPLGFLKKNNKGNWVNYNFYDDPVLQQESLPFICNNIEFLKDITGGRRICFLLGQGKNHTFFSKLNEQEGFFDKIIPLPHPRYIVQYKSSFIHRYIDIYVEALS
jgi:hypothetical protein